MSSAFMRTSPSAQAPRALGGWLWLVAVHLVLSVVSPVRAAWWSVQIWSDEGFNRWFVPQLAVSGVQIIYLSVAISYFFRWKRSAVALMIGWYFLSIGLSAITWLYEIWVRSLYSLGPSTQSPAGLMHPTFASLIGIAYFLRSKRVKQTFVVD